jgi:hypothetical protein
VSKLGCRKQHQTHTPFNIYAYSFALQAMDAFTTIFTSSVSEETSGQDDFEKKNGCGNNYCVIV